MLGITADVIAQFSQPFLSNRVVTSGAGKCNVTGHYNCIDRPRALCNGLYIDNQPISYVMVQVMHGAVQSVLEMNVG